MHSMDKKYYIIAAIIGVIIAGGVTYAWVKYNNAQPGKLDTFAQCLKDKGAMFYGAFWCPHCQAEKALFGKSQKYLPYVECSTPDGNGQLQVCKDKNIESYPTWFFADGTKKVGEVSLQDLAQQTGCTLP